jgi:ubiquinone/menaquinone biosynthesis C-methylase UbiE
MTVDLREGDVRQLPFPAGVATVAIAFGVLEHVRDVSPAVNELRRVLRANGRLFVVTSHRNSLVYAERLARQALHRWPYGYQENHCVESIRGILQPAFIVREIEILQTARDFPAAAIMDRVLDRVLPIPWGRYLVLRCERT